MIGQLNQKKKLALIQKIGSEEIVVKIVNDFFEKVLNDQILGKFFANVDMVFHKEKFSKYLIAGFGGHNRYIWSDLKTAH